MYSHCDCGIEPLAGGYSLEVVPVSNIGSRRRVPEGITEYGRFGRPIDGILSIEFDISSVAALDAWHPSPPRPAVARDAASSRLGERFMLLSPNLTRLGESFEVCSRE